MTDTHALLNGMDHEPDTFEILVADDVVETAGLLVRTVLRPRGYTTHIARTGREVLARVRRSRPDLLITTWQLPDMTAEQLLRTLVDGGWRLPAVIMADSSEALATGVFQLGARGFLSKPLDATEAIQVIRRILTEGWGLRQQTQQTETLRKKLERFVTLAQVIQTLIGLTTNEQLFTRLVEGAIQITGAEEGFLLLLDQETDVLELRAMRGFGDGATRLVRFPTRETSAQQVLVSGRPLRLSGDAAGHKMRTGYLVKGVIHAPIKTAERTVGVLSVDRKISREAFTAEDEELLVQLAGCAAAALEHVHQCADQEHTRQEQAISLQGLLAALGATLDQLARAMPHPDENQHDLLAQIGRALAAAEALVDSQT